MKKVYKSLSKQYPYSRGRCNCGKLTTKLIDGEYICKECLMGLEDKLNPEQKKVLGLVSKAGLTSREIELILKHKSEAPETIQPYECKQTKIKFAVIGDTHIGSKWYDSKFMSHAARVINDSGVDFVIHSGDVCEGHYESHRQGSVFELTEIGGDAQVDRAVKELGKIKKPIYGITGNHEHNTFFKNAGFDIGKQLALRLKNYSYLGNAKGTIKLINDQNIEVLHPDGGSSYAISYRSQKIAESLDGGTKPAVLLIGHFHKAEYLFYRNIQILQTGTFQSQTDFMRNKHLSAHKGFWIVSMEVGKKGVSKFAPEYYPCY